MSKVIIWNVVIGIVLGSVYGATFRIVFGAGGAGRTALKTLGVVILTALSTPYVAPALRTFAEPVFPKTRMERAMESFEARLAAMPEWQERTRGRSRDEVLTIAHELGFRGVSRLDDESLATAAEMLATILAGVDASTCGRIVKGSLGQREVSVVVLKEFEKVDAPTLDAWMGVLYAAASAELRGQHVVTPASRDVAGAMQMLLSQMPRKDAELLRRTLAVVKQSDDEHACWATRTIYHYLSQLPDQPRRDLTRALFSS
ncbi:MAG TPA: hypothetical protein VMI34_15545 [Candidatus Bathyarchaeia archaeon]|nr:hypothetical protein [Candidatus Bathyarchaeia archaeon]